MSDPVSSSLPRAVLSRAALAAAAAAAVAAGGAVADLRRDAWGHGLLGVAQTVTAAGARAVLVDGTGEQEALRLEGIDAVLDAAADIDSRLLYGLPDAEGVTATRPVMRLTGRVLSTKRLLAGEGVSYGYAHRAIEDTRVALLTGGYAQGIPRALGGRMDVEIHGVLHAVVGRVAMDVCVAEIGTAEVADGSEATYFGGTGPARGAIRRWAKETGLGVGELITVVGRHVPREWEA